jgi:hypothetical protein
MLFTLPPTPIIITPLIIVVKVSVAVRIKILGIETETKNSEDVVVIVNTLALTGLYTPLFIIKKLEQLLYKCVTESLSVEVINKNSQLKITSRKTDLAEGKLNYL